MLRVQQAKADSKLPQGHKPHRAGALARSATSFARGAAVGLTLLASVACAPVIDNRGYIFDDRLLKTLDKGSSSMDSVRERFGSPTTVTSLNGQAFYYIYSRFVTESYRAPEEVERKVLAIYFNDNKKLRDFALYGLEDGIIVPIVARTTQTQGKELTILEQLFGNLGRLGDEAPGSDL